MQADATLPAEQRRNYKGVGDALVRIVKEDGVAGLFRGGGPTVVRAMALNMGMLASNDQAKEAIQAAGFEKGSMVPVVGGALIAGFFASACSLPFDFVKTRMQKMTPGADGKMPYAGPVDCALKTLAQEGPLKFYSGFPTYIVELSSSFFSLFFFFRSGVPRAALSRSLCLSRRRRRRLTHSTRARARSSFDQPHTHTPQVRIAPHAVFTLLFLDALPKWEKQIGL
jgi:hypothetical protein